MKRETKQQTIIVGFDRDIIPTMEELAKRLNVLTTEELTQRLNIPTGEELAKRLNLLTTKELTQRLNIPTGEEGAQALSQDKKTK